MKGMIAWCRAHPLIAIVVGILLLVPALRILIGILKLVAAVTSLLLQWAVFGLLLAAALAAIVYLVRTILKSK